MDHAFTLPADFPSPGSGPPSRGAPARAAAEARKKCNCRNSRCLKLYCECFAAGQYCFGCNCQGCHNNPETVVRRKRAIEATLERYPSAFRPKVDASSADTARHNKGCHCKKSGCLKKYCECFQAGILCVATCKCSGCKNCEGNSELTALIASGRAPHSSAKKQRVAEPAADTPGAAAPPAAPGSHPAAGKSAAPALDPSLQRARGAISQSISEESSARLCVSMLRELGDPARPREGAPVGGAGNEAEAARQEHAVLSLLHTTLTSVLDAAQNPERY
jgi:hypothetical protein